MDPLAAFFARFSPSARVFYTGNLCSSTPEYGDSVGHLHVLQAGQIDLASDQEATRTISEPSLLFYPRPHRHRLITVDERGADLICALLDLGTGVSNPLVMSLPDCLVVRLDTLPALSPTLALLFEEAWTEHYGRQAVLDRLTEYLLILLLRHLIDTRELSSGILAGLGDARLQSAIAAMHQYPDRPWTLETLAEQSNLSRARFAARFRERVGTTAMEYLADWRMSIARSMLRDGEPVSRIARAVGYSNASAFSRAFGRRVQVSPVDWLEQDVTEREHVRASRGSGDAVAAYRAWNP